MHWDIVGAALAVVSMLVRISFQLGCLITSVRGSLDEHERRLAGVEKKLGPLHDWWKRFHHAPHADELPGGSPQPC